MRKLTYLFLIAILLITGCTNDSDQERQKTIQEPVWQSQLEQVNQRLERRSRADANDLRLVGYKYKGKLATEAQKSELLKELFADDTKIVLPLDNYGFYYEIIPFKEARRRLESVGVKNPGKYIELRLDTLVKVGQAEIIDLGWCYKNENFHSTAIASSKGLIFDHIGSAVVTSKYEKVTSKNNIVKRLKSRSESDDQTTERYFFLEDHGGLNVFGERAWEIEISCSSFFSSDGILCNKSLAATHHSVGLWNCDAKIETIHGIIGESDYHEFAWGHAHQLGLSVSVDFDGVKFNISSGGDGGTGSIVHTK